MIGHRKCGNKLPSCQWEAFKVATYRRIWEIDLPKLLLNSETRVGLSDAATLNAPCTLRFSISSGVSIGRWRLFGQRSILLTLNQSADDKVKSATLLRRPEPPASIGFSRKYPHIVHAAFPSRL